MTHLQTNVVPFFYSDTYTLAYTETANGTELTMNAAITELLSGSKTYIYPTEAKRKRIGAI